MKAILLFISLLFLTACEGPVPMSAAEAKAFDTCMEKGWKPRFFANTGQREISCERK